MHVRLPCLVTQEGTYEGNARQAWLRLWEGGRSWEETQGVEKREKLTCMEACCQDRDCWKGFEICR